MGITQSSRRRGLALSRVAYYSRSYRLRHVLDGLLRIGMRITLHKGGFDGK